MPDEPTNPKVPEQAASIIARMQAMIQSQNAQPDVGVARASEEETSPSDAQDTDFAEERLAILASATTQVSAGGKENPFEKIDLSDDLIPPLDENAFADMESMSMAEMQAVFAAKPSPEPEELDAMPANEVEIRWLASLPDLVEDEFLLDIEADEERALFCVRELTWGEALQVEMLAFRKTRQGTRDINYFSGHYEQRETLRKAIRWVAEVGQQRIITNSDGQILRRLSQQAVDTLWSRYFPLITVDADEANALYNAARAYFGGRAQEGYPVPPLVVEVDMLRKLGGMTRQELRAMKTSEFERIQLILFARSEELGTNPAEVVERGTPTLDELDPRFATLPPHVREHIMKGNA